MNHITRSIFGALFLLALGGCDTSTTDTPASSSPIAASQKPSPAHKLKKVELEAAATSNAHCSLDEVDSTVLSDATPSITVSTGRTVFAGGWAVTNKLASPRQFTLVLEGQDGAYGFDGVTSVSRPDVAKIFKSDTATKSGFNVAANLGEMPAGTYKVLILMNEGEQNEICDTTRKMVVHN